MIARPNQDPLSVEISQQVYHFLLAAYPKDFRREYSSQMVQVYHDLCLRAYSQNGSMGILNLWVHTFFDLIKSAIEEHIHKETNMNKSTFIRISGWALILGAFSYSLVFLTWYMDENYPLLHWASAYGFATFLIGMVIAPYLVGVGLIGIWTRYGKSIGSSGKNIILAGTVLGLLLTTIGVFGDVIQLFGSQNTDTGFGFLVTGSAVLLFSIALFGFIAMNRKPLPGWNALPILAGIVFPVTLVISYLSGPLDTVSFTWYIAVGLLVQFLAMILLGFLLQRNVPGYESMAAG